MDRGQSQGKRRRTEEEGTKGASTSSSVSSAATGVGSDLYDVFLSFRGLDTRKGFTDHLYHSLVKAGIVPTYVFRDDKSILIGEEFGSQIFNAIARSKISIPIISENYASSKWCLRELIQIMDRKKSSSHIVLPIFYKVAPSHVRHQEGNFGVAFHESEKCFNDEDIQKAIQALGEVSGLQGWESSKVANGHEGELIQLVINTVLSKLQKDFQLDIPRQLVGLDGRLREIMSRVRSPSDDARMIGIYGMGGIGKTTLAKCIYNKLLDEFECASFLPNIREKTTHQDGIKDLQNQLINDICKSKHEVSRIDDGINRIKSRFKGKKVLILLDDIDDKNQLDVLAREREWFMAGSMIIVTTRNEAVLDQSEFEVDYKYEMKGLDEAQSLMLFKRHAFRTDHSQQDFESLSFDIMSTMGGLPLALEVVGSYLYNKTNQKVWEDVRRQLKSQPHRDVEKTLRISYDALEDGHKQIFLDIACFFIGECADDKYMMCMWEADGLYPNVGIEELKLRCLIKIGDDGEFEMHDQLRDLGRSIFCEGQPLEYRSGPWDYNYKGVPRVLRAYEYGWSRFHELMRAASSGDEDLSEVRWLQRRLSESASSLWTANVRLPKLAVLRLEQTDITEDWEGWTSLRESTRLRVLHLVCCELSTTPDLSAFTQLKFLFLLFCHQLEHLHPSIAELKSLVSLDLRYCGSLKELPEEVGELIDLEELDLSESGITQIPTSIRSLGKLKKLTASSCESLRGIPSSIGNLQNLQHLDINNSAIEELPSAIERLKNLQTLDIGWTPISDLPESIKNLSSLQFLYLNGCNKLRSVPELPSSLAHLKVSGQSLRLPQISGLIHLEELRRLDLPELSPHICFILPKLNRFKYLEECSIIINCSSNEILDLSELVLLKRLNAQHCNNLVETQGLDNLEFLECISISNCNSIKNLLCSESGCLKELYVRNCDNLVKIQCHLDSAKFLEVLDIAGCESLETLPDLTGCEMLQYLAVVDCKKLTQLRGLGKLDPSNWHISGCDSLEAMSTLYGERFFWKL